jgi:hypothetical protein
VAEGSSAVDVSLLTGESVPVEVAPGDAVPGAGVNAGGRLTYGPSSGAVDTYPPSCSRDGRVLIAPSDDDLRAGSVEALSPLAGRHAASTKGEPPC